MYIYIHIGIDTTNLISEKFIDMEILLSKWGFSTICEFHFHLGAYVFNSLDMC